MTEIIGTIISSTLDYDNLIKITGDPKVIEPNQTARKPSQWIPADGRSMKNSALHTATGIETTPDMRGKFIRGLNTIYSVEQPDFDKKNGDPDGENRHPGSYQEDGIGKHAHTYSHIKLGFNSSNDGGQGHNEVDVFPDETRTTNPAGGNETRPKNVAVYFYIKIN